jgi:hypothetical protein
MASEQSGQDSPVGRPGWAASPYFVFTVLATILLLIALIAWQQEVAFVPELLVNIGASILTVVVVEWVWRRQGGDPIVSAITGFQRQIKLLEQFNALGIARLLPSRRELEQPQVITAWCELLRHARQVDLMAYNLARGFTRHGDLMRSLQHAIVNNGCIVRVVTLSPDFEDAETNRILVQRIAEESKKGKSARKRMESGLEDTWERFETMYSELGPKDGGSDRREYLKLGFTSEITMYVNLVRIDDRMWVSPYLASATGGSSPAYEVAGRDSSLFQLFLAEFNHMWEHARKRSPGATPEVVGNPVASAP